MPGPVHLGSTLSLHWLGHELPSPRLKRVISSPRWPLKSKYGDRALMCPGVTTLLLTLEPDAKAPGSRAVYASVVKTRLQDLEDIGHSEDIIDISKTPE